MGLFVELASERPTFNVEHSTSKVPTQLNVMGDHSSKSDVEIREHLKFALPWFVEQASGAKRT
jgi:hypothetical protein